MLSKLAREASICNEQQLGQVFIHNCQSDENKLILGTQP